VEELCSTQYALGINIEADIFMRSERVWIDKGKTRDGSRSQLVCAWRFGAIFALAICLAGCGERSQELEERVTRLQKELNRTQDELRNTKQALDATNEELARLKAASTNASTAGPVAPNNASAPASGTSVSENQPPPQQPHQQPVARSAGLPADRSVTIQWPDSGRPPVPANQNPVANPGSSAAGVISQQAGRSGSGGASNRTVVIQWPNNNGAAPSTNQPSAPSGAANPPARVQQPASSATGRSDRTVIIQWPDSGQSPPPRN
jgi:hypothetical protein